MSDPCPTEFRPDWGVHPGQALADVLEDRGWTQALLARQTGLSLKHINQIVHGHVGISAKVALLLEYELGITADYWVRLDGMWRLHVARAASNVGISGH